MIIVKLKGGGLDSITCIKINHSFQIHYSKSGYSDSAFRLVKRRIHGKKNNRERIHFR